MFSVPCLEGSAWEALAGRMAFMSFDASGAAIAASTCDRSQPHARCLMTYPVPLLAFLAGLDGNWSKAFCQNAVVKE